MIRVLRFLSSGLFIAVLLTAGLLGNCAADRSYNNPNYSNAPQTAQAREELFKAIQNMDNKTGLQATPNSEYPYEALQNPYAFKDPQAALEQANTYRETQKLNSIYQSSRGKDSWYYWSNMWLNGPQEATKTIDDTYSAMDNPFAFQDPQAALEQANTYRETQKLNSIYQSSLSEDNWYYWANLWQNWPQT